MDSVQIHSLTDFGARELEQLAEVLVDCVDGGASVSFMAPLSHSKAQTFWRDTAVRVGRRERVVLVAVDERDSIAGTVQVVWAESENQPHRADVAKMLVRRDARRRGIGAALLAAAEEAAVSNGKTLLVLDTADDAALRLYRREGWTLCGEIPDYALWPHGGHCPTTILFKRLSAPVLQR